MAAGWVGNSPGSWYEKMRTIAGYITDGAVSFLKAEYKVLALFALIASVFLGYLGFTGEKSRPIIIIAFLLGAVFSATAGYIGMKIAT